MSDIPPPTRMNQQVFKGKMKAAIGGHRLLKKKSDALKAKFRDYAKEIALTKGTMSEDSSTAFFSLTQAEYAAGNFYINDKPTGAVVGQQPFGGARASGTNDKAGSPLNLLRWVSPRTIKETFVTPVDYRYPFLGE